MKEYWGFYLLKGSTVTVSTCARYVAQVCLFIELKYDRLFILIAPTCTVDGRARQ